MSTSRMSWEPSRRRKPLFWSGLTACPSFSSQGQLVPYAIRDAVGSQLDKLEAEGVLEKVSRSDWAAPIVVVPKQDGSYRLCGDYKVTVNQALDVDQYPLPKPEDLLAIYFSWGSKVHQAGFASSLPTAAP